jgi:hypothetical protein
MSVRLLVKNSVPASASPYRLVDDRNREIAWANEFLDAQKLRQLSLRSVRAYGYDLLHLARWLKATRHPLARLNQSLLLQYVRYQLTGNFCSPETHGTQAAGSSMIWNPRWAALHFRDLICSLRC